MSPGLILLLLTSVVGRGWSYFAREGFTVVIAPQEQICFTKTFTRSLNVVFEYSVTAGGNQDIDARVVTPNGLIIYKVERQHGDEISFDAHHGDFKFCFSNEFSKVTTKRVAFNVRPFDEASLEIEAGEEVSGVRSPSEAFCDNIHFLLTTVMDFQMKYMVRESMGRYVAESLNKRVMWWSLGQSLIVLLACFGQVFVLRRFFTETRPSTKLPSSISIST